MFNKKILAVQSLQDKMKCDWMKWLLKGFQANEKPMKANKEAQNTQNKK